MAEVVLCDLKLGSKTYTVPPIVAVTQTCSSTTVKLDPEPVTTAGMPPLASSLAATVASATPVQAAKSAEATVIWPIA